MEIDSVLICECNSPEHQIMILYDPEDKDVSNPFNCVYAETHLANSKNFFERLKYAVKYLFGHKSRYGAFDEFIFKPEDWEKLYYASKYLKELNDKKYGREAGEIEEGITRNY